MEQTRFLRTRMTAPKSTRHLHKALLACRGQWPLLNPLHWMCPSGPRNRKEHEELQVSKNIHFHGGPKTVNQSVSRIPKNWPPEPRLALFSRLCVVFDSWLILQQWTPIDLHHVLFLCPFCGDVAWIVAISILCAWLVLRLEWGVSIRNPISSPW
jgi:hypothetical protein